MIKVNNKGTRTTPRRSGFFTVNLEHISHHTIIVSIVNSEQVNASWAAILHAKNPVPLQPSLVSHIETSHLICTTNQMPGFYMKCICITGLKWVIN